MKPFVCIILVNYNGAKDTVQCVNSIKKIKYTNYKIIIVDNASTDDSIIKIKNNISEIDYELLIAKENNGFSSGNNIAIRKSLDLGADYILLLNNDTIVEVDFLDKLISEFDNDLYIGATTPKILYESDREKVWYNGGKIKSITGKTKHFDYDRNIKEAKYYEGDVSFASGCCICISKEVIEKIGLLDESYFLYDEDVDYCLRITRAKYLIKYVPQSVIFHKVSASTGTNSGLIQYYIIRNKFLTIKKHYIGIKSIIPYIYSIVMFLKRIIYKEIEFINFFYAILDFNRKKFGRSERNFR